MVIKETYEDASTALGKIDGDRVEVALFTTCVRDCGCDGDGTQETVDKDPI